MTAFLYSLSTFVKFINFKDDFINIFESKLESSLNTLIPILKTQESWFGLGMGHPFRYKDNKQLAGKNPKTSGYAVCLPLLMNSRKPESKSQVQSPAKPEVK